MIGVPHRFALEHAGEQRPDLVPDLGPGLTRAAPQRAWMFAGSEDGPERLVVKLRVLAAPDDHHRKLGAQHHLDEQAQLFRPRVHRSDGGRWPWEGEEGARVEPG